ncbi:MAG: hypothetical protein WC069_02935 [Candidatus Shapirobacteria bacterium]
MKVETSLNAILTSKTRAKLINIFFTSPQEIFYVRQLVRATGEEINSVRRELQNLTKINLVLPENRGNRLYYSTNSRHHLFPFLLSLAYKSLPFCELLSKSQLVITSYQFLLGRNVDKNQVDVIVVGELTTKIVESAMKTEETRRGHEINYMIMDKDELRLRQNKRDPFLVDFFLLSPVVIIGSPQILSDN